MGIFKNVYAQVFLFTVIFVLLSGCSKKDDISNMLNGSTYAPSNIVGNALVLYNTSMKAELSASDFTSAGGCHVSDGGSKGTYSFTKGQNNNAKLNLHYSWKIQISHDYTNADFTYDVILTFTSKTEGTYKGTLKDVEVSNTASFNKNVTNSIFGTFTLF